ncbi:hypothetical protein Tco_0386897 [Tanacetum coccineum]
MHHDTLVTHPIHSGNVIDWAFLASHGLNVSFFESIYSDPFSGPQWANLFQINERVYRELVREFFASIEFESTACRDGEFFVGGTSMKEVRDPNVRLAHRCIATTISGRKDFTQSIIKIDLFYLYYIYAPWVVCNIPYWLTKYLKGMVDVLSVEPPVYIFKKKSLIVIGIVMELHGGACYWPALREAGKVMRLTRRLRRTLVDQQTCTKIWSSKSEELGRPCQGFWDGSNMR